MQRMPAMSGRASPASHVSLPRVHNVGPDSAAMARHPMPYGGWLPKDTRPHTPLRLARLHRTMQPQSLRGPPLAPAGLAPVPAHGPALQEHPTV